MDPVVVMFGGLILILLLFAVALGLWHPRTGRQIVGGSLRSDEAEAEIEAHDIDMMIEARNARRRRLGKPEIGDELAAQLQPDLRRHHGD